MKLAYCKPELTAPAELLDAVRRPNPSVVEELVSSDRELVWADHLFLAACRVPGYDGHGGAIPDGDKMQKARCEVVSLLVAYGADPSMRNKRKVSPLHMACRFGPDELAAHLVALGADLEARDAVKETPLYRAVNLGYEKCARALLDAGADPNVQNRKGLTPLHRAVMRGKSKIVPLLLKAGADPALPDRTGKTALEYSRNAQITELLKSNA